MNVYELECDLENYTSFELAPNNHDEEEIEELLDDRSPGDPWVPFGIKKSLEGYRGEKENPRAIGDFTNVGGIGGADVFSERAVRVLGEVLTENGEVLPLIHDGVGLFLFFVIRIVDALDKERSNLFRLDDGRDVCASGYHFRANAVNDLLIFTTPECSNRSFVTDTFIEHVKKADLKGFDFRKVD